MKSFKAIADALGSGRNRVEDRVTVAIAELRALGVRRTPLVRSTLVDIEPDKKRRRRIQQGAYARRYRRVEGRFCVYCARLADGSGDHVPPLSQAFLSAKDERFFIYPACRVCNDILGADRRLCLQARAEVVAAKLTGKLFARQVAWLGKDDQGVILRRVGRMIIDRDYVDICRCRSCEAERRQADAPDDFEDPDG